MKAFKLQQIFFNHCGSARIVFYPRYFEMINILVEEWFAQVLGMPFEVMHGEMNAAVWNPVILLNRWTGVE